MRIVALLATFNERRFVSGCIENLNAQGVLVYLIDNESTDDTVEIAERYLGRGLIGIETLPREATFDLRRQLERKQELAATLDADWFMHVDTDERRHPPDPAQTLAEAFEQADSRGFNAINFLEFVFVPTAESPDHDHPEFESTMRWYYPFVPSFPNRLNAWKRQPQPVDLVSGESQLVSFEGLKMSPRSMFMRHYLFLSVEHAAEKYARRMDPIRHEVAVATKNWRADFEPGRLVLPSEREMRGFRPGRMLDRSEPSRVNLPLAGWWLPTRLR